MTPENLDWELEARRVARAFGLSGECKFIPWYDGARQFQLDGDSLAPLSESAKLFIAYEGAMKFTIWRGKEFDTYIGIAYDGKVRGQTFAGRFTNTMARGLFHLGLLTPEVEVVLKVSVSAHEKTEWKLEYEERYGL